MKKQIITAALLLTATGTATADDMSKEEHLAAGHGALALIATANGGPAMRPVNWMIDGAATTHRHQAVIWVAPGTHLICLEGTCVSRNVETGKTTVVALEIVNDK